MYIYIYIYTYTCLCIHIYIYIYVPGEADVPAGVHGGALAARARPGAPGPLAGDPPSNNDTEFSNHIISNNDTNATICIM